MPHFDAAVIGSGPNGLSAALAMALTGRRVVVYEAASTPGGGMRTEELLQPGVWSDACSSVHPMAFASPFWSRLPLEQHGLRWIQPDHPYAHPLDGGDCVWQSRSLEETEESMGEPHPGWWRDLIRRWPELARDAMAPLGIPRSPLLLARFGLRGLLPTTWLAKSAFRGARARALFAGAAAHSVLPLDRSPSSAIGLMLSVAGQSTGWPLPEGGAASLTRALMGLLESLGGELITERPIRSLEEVETSGPILFDTSPRAMAAIAGEALPAGYRRRLQRFRYGPGACKVDWVLSEPIPWSHPAAARAGTVHVGGTLEELVAAERAPWEGRLTEQPFVLVVQPTICDPSRAPEGRHVAWGYCHVPPGCEEDRTASIEAQVERFAPGFRDCILARHVTTAVDLERYNPNYIGGDVNGGAAALDQLLTRPLLRLNPYTTPHPRLFLCSASTPPGGGVHGMCGFYAARSALRGELPSLERLQLPALLEQA